jgi:MOSC domain-containing protein YiiM
VADVRRSPSDEGTVALIVCRPAVGERRVLAEATLDVREGLIGDGWHVRDQAPHPDRQLTLMNARAAALVAGSRERWPLAGDQLFVDLDLGEANLPPGTRLRIGSAEIEVTAEPHRGCGKFSKRFGVDAVKFVNSAVGRELNLRGINAKVVDGGTVRTGDPIRRRPVF